MIRRGRVHRFGANVNTDDVIAGKYKHRTLDLDELSAHLMENIRPGFADAVQPGDFLVAGENFGCGSSREQAPQIIKHVGIAAVVAPSFARIFFRNALNIGLLTLTCQTDGIAEGDEIAYDAAGGAVVLADGSRRPVPPMAPEIAGIVEAGGLIPYIRAGGAW